MFILAYAHIEEREFPEAVAVLDDLLANADNPKCATSETLPVWHYWRGRAAFDNAWYKEAVESFTKAVELAPMQLEPNVRRPGHQESKAD